MLGSIRRISRLQRQPARNALHANSSRPMVRVGLHTKLPASWSGLAENTRQLCERAQADLKPSPSWSAGTLARQSLRSEIDRQLAQLKPAYDFMLGAETARDRWLLSELSMALWALDERFLHHYKPSAGKPVSEAITSAHLITLYQALVEAFEYGNPEQRAQLLSVLPHELCIAAGMAPDAETRQLAERCRADRGWHLNIDESLALVDYLHPKSMSFHALNTGLRLQAYWRIGGVADACDAFATAFRSALLKLEADPAFLNREGVYYKGIEAKGAYLPNQWLLSCLSSHQGSLLPPHAVSATRLPMQSFAAVRGRPQDSEVLIRVPEAVDVSIFHGRSGKALGEVIILPRPLKVTGSEATERRGRKFRQWQLEDAPQSSIRLRLRES